ncbi:MAG: hypothetical protein L6R37_007446 [Teloschistes peruensis]|nr:MAG: hypothetical protein L6R37_007446 [Teloschistes peruensis]
MAMSVTGIPIDESSHFSNPLYERQTATAGLELTCDWVADGPPKGKAFHHMQVTDNNACGSESCSTSKIKEHTFGIEAGIEGFDVKAVDVPISFGVTEEWTNGEQYTCNADNGTVCVWLNVAYTTFNAKGEGNYCKEDSNPGEFKFPNENNAGGGYYCVRGDQYCRSIDANYWE